MKPSRILRIAATLLLAGSAPTEGQGTADPAADALTPAVHRMAFGPGDTIAVTSLGSGPTVVIVPGLLGGAYGFRHVTPLLVAQGMRVVTFEPLGMGTSARPRNGDYSLEAQAERVGRVLRNLGVREALLLCHSVGASICYRYALREPDRVRGIVAVNGGPDESAATDGLRRAARLAPLLRIFGGAGKARARLEDGLIESSADPAWLTDDVLEAYTGHFGDFNAALDAISGMAEAREPAALAPRLPELAVPVRLLVSEVAGTSPSAVDALRAVPDFVVWGIRDAGQYIQEERPAAVADAVITVHRQLPPVRR